MSMCDTAGVNDLPVHSSSPFDMQPLSGSLELVRDDVKQFIPYTPQTICHGFDLVQPGRQRRTQRAQ
jgi:hypothetical protein